MQVLVRINDRGPATPHRLVEVTRRTATLLGFPTDGAVRVRLQVLPVESHAAVDAVPGAPGCSSRRRRAARCRQSRLPPPGSAAPADAGACRADRSRVADAGRRRPNARLPETVTQASPDPGSLFVQLGTFQNSAFANIQRARVAGLGARIVSTREGRVQTHRVMIGPLATVRQADAVLDQVLAAGVTDARIVVE